MPRATSRTPSHRILRSLTFGGLAFVGGALSAHWATAAAGNSPYAVLGQLARVLVLVENEYVQPVPRAGLLEGAIRGMVADLDPHSAYLPSRDFKTFRADTEGRFGGVGVEVDFRNDSVTIISTVEGSPAARAGLRPGDTIVAIDKQQVRGKKSSELVDIMRGPPGSKVQLTIRRKGRRGLLNFHVAREIIEVASVSATALDDGIAYLRLKQFQRGTHTELLEQIAKVRAEQGGSISGAIVDLRNNPGGLVREAVAVADEFLSEGLIYSTRQRSTIVDSVEATSGGALLKPPLVVLLNEYSASASELVAGALQDNDRATVVGAPSFGKGSVQTIFELPDRAALRLTTMRYYTPSGNAIQARGITPDVHVEAAYVPDKSFGVVRERDLDNHLPAESGNPKKSSAKVEPESAPEEEETGISPTHLGVARNVERDPTGGADFAMSIGYQIVRGEVRKRRRRRSKKLAPLWPAD